MYWAFSTTMRASVRWPLVLALSILLAIGFLSPASTRDWKPTAKAKALDYSQIVDDRGNGEIIFIWWVVPQTVDENYAETKRLLDKNVLIAVAHAHFAADGTVTFDAIDNLHANDTDGTPLELFHESDMPPAVAGAITTLKSVFRGAVGAMGRGIHWFAFKGGAARACSKGRLSVQFAGANYTYDTPIPGCPQA